MALDPHRSQSTVAYYERYRLAYPQPLLARVAALADLEPGDAVLDLGCGTGMLAVGFAKLGLRVTAMDPAPEMLAATEAAAKAAGVAVTLVKGSSYDLTPDMGPFRLAAMGRSFHWMDRAATLAMLERIVTPDGGVAFFHDAHPPVAENAWFKILRDMSLKYQDKADAAERRKGGHHRYEPYLYASAFQRLDGLSITIRQDLGVEDIVGRAFSLSTCAPEKLGARKEVFAADLSAALLECSPDGTFTEIAELVALLARRPE
jgi:ubiquinone/menaquinone biosynthesis C-methylase UbiE